MSVSCSFVDSLQLHGIIQARILEWAAIPSPRIFPAQGLNPSLRHCRKILSHLRMSEWMNENINDQMLLSKWKCITLNTFYNTVVEMLSETWYIYVLLHRSIHPIRVRLFLSSWDTAVTLNLTLSFYTDIKCCLRWDIL